MTGNPASNPSKPRFLLDESLAPAVAQALVLVDYKFVNVRSEIRRQSVKDPEIIQWCQENEAIWVHADVAARNKHGTLLQNSGIRTLLVERPKSGMSPKEQLRVLSFVLPRLLNQLERRRAPRHYVAKAANPTSTPTLRPMSI